MHANWIGSATATEASVCLSPSGRFRRLHDATRRRQAQTYACFTEQAASC